MQGKEKYQDEVLEVLDSTTREHATSFEGAYCFDSIIDNGKTHIAIKVSKIIDNVDAHASQELRKICPILRCSPLLIGERTRKGPIQDGVVHTRGDVPVINLETLRQMLEEQARPYLKAKKGGVVITLDGQKLKEAREAKNYSRGDIAEVIGLSRRAIYEYERGTMNPTIEIALHLEELLDIPLVEPIDLFDLEPGEIGSPEKTKGVQSRLVQRTLQVLSKLGINTTLTKETPFDLLAAIRRNVILSCLQRCIEQLDESRLLFLAKLADVLKEHPVIIASDLSEVETIKGIPVIYLRELAEIKNSTELVKLIQQRRGT